MPSLNNVSLDFKVFDCSSKEEKINQFKMLMKDPEVQPFFRNYIENIIATSELRILKRLSAVETALGLNDFSDFEDEEREPNIPEKIEALKEEIQNIEYKAPVNTTITLEPTSKTEVRASLLVSELKDSGKDHLTSHEIIHFLKSKLPDNCKVNERIQNIRKVKQDVLKAASNMYPDVNNVFNFPAKPVPEFPSVAIPVAAILGIIVIFGKRKD